MITYGDYDIVVEAETENSEKMDNIIISKIRNLEKIRSTITLRVTI
jgi:DNA-binding Lrp family transcriptional regulator